MEEDGFWVVDPAAIRQEKAGFSGEAVDRLAKFEDVYEAILAQQERLNPKLEQMRLEGKNRTYQFKELTGKKLMNAHLLTLFKNHGL